MITFKTFLQENSEIETIEEFISDIQTHCHEFISTNKNMMKLDSFLTRGIPGDGARTMFTRAPRRDRQPLSTNPNMHKALDQFFLKRFGFKYRSGGLFTVQHAAVAGGYGHNYAIFPVDGYKLCFSSEIADLFDIVDTPSIMSDFYFDTDPDITPEELDENFKAINKGGSSFEVLFDLLNEADYQESKSYSKAKRMNEIMIKCDQYYAIKYRETKELRKVFE